MTLLRQIPTDLRSYHLTWVANESNLVRITLLDMSVLDISHAIYVVEEKLDNDATEPAHIQEHNP
jgi:hypothetical protein